MKVVNFLKRIELQGFKSFANKTVLEFPARVTAVVGPNGSGKSNIFDAFRWVLGEREVRQLRGEKLENLIFAGTPKKPAAGLAKVTLYFDNQQGHFSLEREEIALTRKVDRSGVSQFFWNDKEIRLKDLIPLLAKVRIGSRGLMMIGQGESDIFVKSTPQERRMFIEEILGLREYRLKKIQAERQLEQSRINLEKAKASMAELMPHLRFLRRQKIRWEKREQIEKELRELENNFFGYRYQKIKKNLIDLEALREKIEQQFSQQLKVIKELEEEVKKIKTPEITNEIGRLRQESKEYLEKRSKLERELALQEARAEIMKEEEIVIEPAKILSFLTELKKDLEKVLAWDDLVKIKLNLENWLKKISSFLSPRHLASHKEKEILTNQEKSLREEITAIDKKLDELSKKEEEILIKQSEANKKFRELVESLELKKQERRQIEQKKERLLFEKEKLEMQLKELKNQWQNLGREITELSELKGEPLSFEEEGAEMERKIFRLRAELAAIGEIDPSLVKEAEEAEERYQFLQKEIKDLEKASSDLKTMIKELELKIHHDFQKAFHLINEEFNNFFRLMFGGGRAHLKLQKQELRIKNEGENSKEKIEIPVEENNEDKEVLAGVEIELTVPRKKIKSLEMLSGGEKSLVSLAALFALIAVSPPPFLVLDEIDAALDDINAQRFAQMVKEFSHQTQFIIITHNHATMEAADILYGVTMGDDGVSKVLSLKLE